MKKKKKNKPVTVPQSLKLVKLGDPLTAFPEQRFPEETLTRRASHDTMTSSVVSAYPSRALLHLPTLLHPPRC